MTTTDSRHDLIPGWRQDLLRRSTVVIAGVGALGNEVSRLLAMGGVGRLILCDPDRVEASNLNRSILFRKSDIGRRKVDAAAAALAELAPETTVEVRPAPHVNGVGLADLRDADLVISCLDSLGARILLARRCTAVGAGLLDAGTQPWGGEVRYYAHGGPCLACGLGELTRGVRDDPWSCDSQLGAAPVGASAAVSALIGAWEATLALRLLLDLPVRATTMSIESSGELRLVKHATDRTCPLHEKIEPASVTRTPVATASTVRDLTEHLSVGEEAFTWSPFDDAAGRPSTRIRSAPADTTLAELGVATREILLVAARGAHRSTRFIELHEAGGRS